MLLGPIEGKKLFGAEFILPINLNLVEVSSERNSERISGRVERPHESEHRFKEVELQPRPVKGARVVLGTSRAGFEALPSRPRKDGAFSSELGRVSRHSSTSPTRA